MSDGYERATGDLNVTALAETLTIGQLTALIRELSIEKARAVVEEVGIVDMAGVADLIGVNYHRVKMLRRGPDDAVLSAGADRLPNELKVPGSSPIYLSREIMLWARQTGRVNSAGQPVRLRPVGRPPKSGRRRDDAGRFLTV